MLLCIHDKLIGKSPLCREQVKDTGFPELKDSSPKSRGKMWGGTKKNYKIGIDLNELLNEVKPTRS